MNDLDQALCDWEILIFDAEDSGFTSSCNTWIRMASFFSLLWLVFSSSINMLQYYIVYPQSFSCSLKQLERAKLREWSPPQLFSFSLCHDFLWHIYTSFFWFCTGASRFGCTNRYFFFTWIVELPWLLTFVSLHGPFLSNIFYSSFSSCMLICAS